MARQKKVVHANISREQMEEAFGRYAAADAQAQRITAQMDEQIVRIREKNADALAALETQKREAFDVMEAYARENREELFAKRRSIDTTHGVLGFRIGMPRLKPRRGFTWAAALELLKRSAPAYVRVEEAPAKDRLLADRDDEACVRVMEACGIEVVQDETFFVEPRKEQTQG